MTEMSEIIIRRKVSKSQSVTMKPCDLESLIQYTIHFSVMHNLSVKL